VDTQTNDGQATGRGIILAVACMIASQGIILAGVTLLDWLIGGTLG